MAAIHSRYARALADVVVSAGLDPARTVAELHALAGVIADSPELRTALENPSVPSRQKLALLDAIVARTGASRYVRNFVALLVDHRRVAALPAMARQFSRELNERLGLTEAEVTSTRLLEDGEKQRLTTRLEVITGRKVLARYAQNAALLGGAIIRVGSTVYDGSLRGQLSRLKERLSGS